MLVCLERVLLVIGNEFKYEDAERGEREDVVRSSKVGVWLEYRGDECWHSEEKEKDVLGCGDESEVCELEKPGWDLGTKDGPAVIFVFSG